MESKKLFKGEKKIKPKCRTGVVYDTAMFLHIKNTTDHPENPARIRSIVRKIMQDPTFSRAIANNVESRQATEEELCMVHDPAYVRAVNATETVFVKLHPPKLPFENKKRMRSPPPTDVNMEERRTEEEGGPSSDVPKLSETVFNPISDKDEPMSNEEPANKKQRTEEPSSDPIESATPSPPPSPPDAVHPPTPPAADSPTSECEIIHEVDTSQDSQPTAPVSDFFKPDPVPEPPMDPSIITMPTPPVFAMADGDLNDEDEEGDQDFPGEGDRGFLNSPSHSSVSSSSSEPEETVKDEQKTATAEWDALRVAIGLTTDTEVDENTARAARLAAGCPLALLDRIVKDQDLLNGFAIIRPPGHHAGYNRSEGFCFFNNVMVAAMYAQKKLGVEKVMIVDWDVHHGNGTEDLIEHHSTENILFFSVHRFGNIYPGSGDVDSSPSNKWIVNLPLNPMESFFEEGGSVAHCEHGFGDAEFLRLFDQVVLPMARHFDPDLVLVSGGFDAACGDPLGQFLVSPQGYGQMTKKLMTLAGGRVVVLTEGGYQADMNAECAVEVLRTLMGVESFVSRKTTRVIAQTKARHQAEWPVFDPVPVVSKNEDFKERARSLATSSLSGRVRLNVGGRALETTKDTLLSAGGVLAELFGEKALLLPDLSGTYFMDRDGDLFAHLLAYLRSGPAALGGLPSSTKKALLEEAKFFGVSKLVDELSSKQ